MKVYRGTAKLGQWSVKLDGIGRFIVEHDCFVHCVNVHHYFIFLNSKLGWGYMHISGRLSLSNLWVLVNSSSRMDTENCSLRTNKENKLYFAVLDRDVLKSVIMPASQFRNSTWRGNGQP